MSQSEDKDFSLVPEDLAATREEFIQKIRCLEAQSDKPKTHRRCGDCLAYKTHFCPLWLRGNGEVTTRTTDHACSDWVRRPFPERHGRFSWAEVVTNL